MTPVPTLFDSVADKDYLHLLNGSEPNYKEVLNLTGFEKKDISRATGVSQSSIRYDGKVPQEIRERFLEWANLFNLVAQHFNGDIDKTALWLQVRNPFLGDISPKDMIRIGRYKKLISFVQSSLNENRRAS
jgi:hypothetical protein